MEAINKTCEAKRRADVPLALNELSQAIDALVETYKELDERLRPVTKNVPPSIAKDSEKPEEGSACDISIQIRSSRNRINNLKEEMGSQIGSLEI
jgi:hypothetical protein